MHCLRARTRRRSCLTIAVVAVSTLLVGIVVAPASGAATFQPDPALWHRSPTADELGLLAVTNETRTHAHLTQLAWNDSLGDAARYHTVDLVTDVCDRFALGLDLHDQCNGEDKFARVTKFYGAFAGENVATASSKPAEINAGFLGDAAHAANVLRAGATEFGTGIMTDLSNDFRPTYVTEDFGAGTVANKPIIPAAAVLQPASVAYTDPEWNWSLLLNYVNTVAPTSVQAIVDGQPKALTLSAGTTKNGSWRATVTTDGYHWPDLPGQFCRRVHFVVTLPTRAQLRWPRTGELGLGLAPGCANQPVDQGTSITLPPPVPPVATISSPQNGASVSGKVRIAGSATDDMKVAAIEIWIDGKKSLRRAAASVAKVWNTALGTVAAGRHTIVVKAYDNDQPANVGTASVTVTVTK